MVANVINPSLFNNASIKTLAQNNPEKLGDYLKQYNQYAADGGKCSQEDFIVSAMADEGGIDMFNGGLPAAHAQPSEAAKDPLKTPFKNAACQLLAERDFERCCELMNEYGEEQKRSGTLASKIDMESYIELHADLEPGQVPWPADVQAALRKAGK